MGSKFRTFARIAEADPRINFAAIGSKFYRWGCKGRNLLKEALAGPSVVSPLPDYRQNYCPISLPKLLRDSLAAIIIFATIFICTPRLSGAEQKVSEQHLVFKKSVVVKKYKDGRVYSEPYTVKKGEHLWKILREHYKLSNPKIAFYCKVAKAVNPEINDINKIRADQNILVPYKYLEDIKTLQGRSDLPSSDVAHVVVAGEHFAKILRDHYNLPDSIIFHRRTYRLFKEANPQIEDINELSKGQRIVIPAGIFGTKEMPRKIAAAQEKIIPEALKKKAGPDRGPDPKEAEIRDMISLFTRSFEGTDNRTGRDKISLKRGTIHLDYAKFPLYEFPWGKRILFDYGGRMPQGIKQIINTEWDNAEVVAVKEKDDMESILDKVLDACGVYKVEKEGEYIVKRDNIQVSVSGNWIVFKDNMLKNVFVVNLVEEGETSITPELKSYLSSLGLKLVDIQFGRKGPEKEQPVAKKKIDYRRVESEPVIIIDLILEILGHKYHKDYNTKIFQNMYSGFSLEVMADRMFEKEGSTFLIDFHDLPAKICEIIAEQGFHLLKIDPQEEEPKSVVKKVLDFCGAEYKSSQVEFRHKSGKKSSIKLTIPGFLIKAGAGDVLFTQVDLQEPIIQFLAEKNVKIVKF